MKARTLDIQKSRRLALSRMGSHCASGRQRGFALILVLILSIIAVTIGLFSALGSRTEMSLAHNDLLVKQALSAAEAGVAHAARLISTHAVPNDELAQDGGGVCTAWGIGNAASGIAAIGSVVDLNGGCYRFRQFGPDQSDGYYIVVEDNKDDGVTDAPHDDKDNTLRVSAIGVAGTAMRRVGASMTAPPTYGFFGIDSVSLTGSSGIDSYTGPTYTAPGEVPGAGKVGSNGNIELNGNSGIGGNATAGGIIDDKHGGVTGAKVPSAPPQTFAPVASCAPYSSSSGITGSYNASTGALGNNVTIAPGTYCFSSIGGSLTINPPGPVTINLTSGGLSDGPINAPPGDAINLRVNVSGSGSMKFTSSHVLMGMVLYAPGYDVQFNGGNFYGSIVAKSLDLRGNASLHHQRWSTALWLMSATHEIR
jgi:hypothetical protein